VAEFALRELIDEKRLQHLQNEFCKVTGVMAVCVDKEGRAITEPYIDKSLIRPDGEDPILGEYRKKAAQALDRVQEGSLEEQVVEELPDGGHVAAVAVSVENQIILYWQVYDLKKLDTISFYQILDLLRDTSADIYRDRMSCFSAEAESRRSRYAEEEMSRNLHTIEATTEIVQLLDSDDQIELAMNRWLKILAQHIQVDSAEIFQLQADTDTMNVVCEWLAPGLISYFDKTSGIPEKSFLHTEKPLVVSTDSVGKPDSEEIEKIGMKAVMIFPILKQESGNMVLSLNHRRQGHVWSMAEIKFTSDAVKILQSILTRRIQKNSLAGSYAALEEILDNVGCAIYVTDQNTGRMLFANQILKNTFAKELMDHNFDALLQSSIHKDKTRTVSVVYHAEKETWYDLLCKEIAWVDGKKANLYSLYDITDKKLYQRRIEQQAYTDFLTGLYNRMCCERDLARQIDQAKKIGGKGALLYLDLDDFKHINDGLGHQYGDVLLKSISHALKRIMASRIPVTVWVETNSSLSFRRTAIPGLKILWKILRRSSANPGF
jgi:PAS domain-containing protein